MSNALRIVFAGTPDFALPTLNALLAEKDVVGVFTQPDRPAGRGRKLRSSPVKVIAQAQAIPVYQPATLKSAESQSILSKLQPDLMVVVAYGLILPQAILDLPRLGCVNVHGSLLPRWRGAGPVQRAILAGDTETGVTIMQMDAGLDTGPMLHKAATQIGPRETAGELSGRLAEIGANALTHVLKDLETGELNATAQDESHATYATKIIKAEACLDFSESAQVLSLRVRAFNPAPVAYALLGGERLRIWQAHPVSTPDPDHPPGTILRQGEELVVATGGGNLVLEKVQPAGGRTMRGTDYLKSRSHIRGLVFGQ